jgi:hypothetical protein
VWRIFFTPPFLRLTVGTGGLPESKTAGREHFVEDIKQRLAGRVQGSYFVSHSGISALKEPQATYKTLFDGKKGIVSLDNAYLLNCNSTNSKY